MNDNINLFDENLKNQEISYISEELELNDLEKKYQLAKKNIKKNNKKRIKIISGIRENKIKEINEELESSKIELKELKADIKKMIKKYCEINGHEGTIIRRKIVLDAQTRDHCDNNEYNMSVIFKCKTCGKKYEEQVYGNISDYPLEKYEKCISSEVYNDNTLMETGKSIKNIENEVTEIENYVNYLLCLKKKICELFGHDAKRIKSDKVGNDIFKCNCCGMRMNHKEYIRAHYSAKYKNIVPYYYEDKKDVPVCLMSLNTSSDNYMMLPSYEEYQNKLVLKKDKN